MRRLLARLKESTPPGIIYAPTRRATEELAERLIEEGMPAVAYHGGMSAGDRERAHEAFLADEVESWSRRPRSAWASTSPTSAG